MDSHHRHFVLVVIVTGLAVGHQRDILQEVCKPHGQFFLTSVLHEVLKGVYQFLQILLTRRVVGIRSAVNVRRYPALLDDVLTEFEGVIHAQSLAEAFYHQAEEAELVCRSLVYLHSVS